MTIIEPNKNGKKVTTFLIYGGMILSVFATWSIMLYSETVNLAHALNSEQEAYNAASSELTKLKNELFTLTDAKKLRVMAEQLGLKRVRSPEYIEVGANVVALTQ